MLKFDIITSTPSDSYNKFILNCAPSPSIKQHSSMSVRSIAVRFNKKMNRLNTAPSSSFIYKHNNYVYLTNGYILLKIEDKDNEFKGSMFKINTLEEASQHEQNIYGRHINVLKTVVKEGVCSLPFVAESMLCKIDYDKLPGGKLPSVKVDGIFINQKMFNFVNETIANPTIIKNNNNILTVGGDNGIAVIMGLNFE